MSTKRRLRDVIGLIAWRTAGEDSFQERKEGGKRESLFARFGGSKANELEKMRHDAASVVSRPQEQGTKC